MPERTWLKTIPLLNSEDGQAIVREACQEHKITSNDFFDIVEAKVEEKRGERRRQLFEAFDDIFERTGDNVD